MFFQPGAEISAGLTYVFLMAVCTSNFINISTFLEVWCFILGVDYHRSDGVKWLMVSPNTMVTEDVSELVRKSSDVGLRGSDI